MDNLAFKPLVVIPTYNEAENISPLVMAIRTLAPVADILIVDDGSPDGTGEVAKTLSSIDSNIHVLHRTQKGGLGRAYEAGFKRALESEYTHIVEMDADGSHRPEDLAELLEVASEGTYEIVLGSRWVPGGQIQGWPMHRMVISKAANFYARTLLNIPFGDVTGGFRVYSSDLLRKLIVEPIDSSGYGFQVEMLTRGLRAGASVVEVPITFVERIHGKSKLTYRVALEGAWNILRWRFLGRSL